MAQPTPYPRQANFTDWSEEHPSTPHQGVSLDAEFNAIVTTTAAIIANLALIQRDDGALKNASVGIEALSAGVLAVMNAATGIVASAWVTAHVYDAGTNWVSQGTGTYICATSHTSGTFATDLAAGKWVLIYDSAGATPADGSVTTPKIVDGAVTLAKLTLTLLDLTGTIRAQGGLAAGTATVGELLAAKKDSGNVYAKIQRATRDQGEVGLQIDGGTSSVVWRLRMDDDLDSLELYDGTAARVSWTGALSDFAGRVRATGDATPANGAGIALRFAASIGYLDCYDHTAAAWRAAQLRASTLAVVCGGVTVMSVSSTDVNFPVGASLGGSSYSIGYLDAPPNAQSAAYVLTLADRGKHIYSENVAGQAVTIPPNSSVAFPLGTSIAIVNRGTNPITVTQGIGVTLRWAGTSSTGNRTLAVNGLGTLFKIGTDVWMLSGAGVS